MFLICFVFECLDFLWNLINVLWKEKWNNVVRKERKLKIKTNITFFYKNFNLDDDYYINLDKKCDTKVNKANKSFWQEILGIKFWYSVSTILMIYKQKIDKHTILRNNKLCLRRPEIWKFRKTLNRKFTESSTSII